MIIETLDVDFENVDDRGSLYQLAHCGYSQVNVVFSKSGVIRGNHYHRLNVEAFYVVKGKCEVTVSNDKEEETKVFVEKDFFRIPPNTLHSFKYIEDTIMVTMYSLGVELPNGDKDILN